MLGGKEEQVQPNPDDDLSYDDTPRRPGRSRKRGEQSEASLDEALSSKRPRKRKALNKKERLQVMDHIKSTPVLPVLTRMFEQRESSVFQKLLDNQESLASLIQFHQRTFLLLYEANGIGKDKYITFQLQWHKYCSIFLLPKENMLQCIFSPPTKEMDTVHQIWLAFCERELQGNSGEQKRFMIMFSSSIYEILLREAHEQVMKLNDSTGSSSNLVMEADQDDVYFRFGGATLASMLHNRYKDIRKCNAEKREIVSLEIKVLHAINTKNKESMPSYLQYRDRGYMYSPDPSFLPLFRAVDECIKSIVNEKGIQEHGDQLVKV